MSTYSKPQINWDSLSNLCCPHRILNCIAYCLKPPLMCFFPPLMCFFHNLISLKHDLFRPKNCIKRGFSVRADATLCYLNQINCRKYVYFNILAIF